MKLKFKNQDFQKDAVNSVVDLFLGQEKTKGTFSVDNNGMDNFLGTMGVGNALLIDQKTLADNMHAVQRRNNLPLTEPDWGSNFGNVDFSNFSFRGNAPQFCIEMETGTGKTYVYTKTILN